MARVLSSNVLAALGIACMVLATGELAGFWWALLELGPVLLAMSFVRDINDRVAADRLARQQARAESLAQAAERERLANRPRR
jgi:hypothetical protein